MVVATELAVELALFLVLLGVFVARYLRSPSATGNPAGNSDHAGLGAASQSPLLRAPTAREMVTLVTGVREHGTLDLTALADTGATRRQTAAAQPQVDLGACVQSVQAVLDVAPPTAAASVRRVALAVPWAGLDLAAVLEPVADTLEELELSGGAPLSAAALDWLAQRGTLPRLRRLDLTKSSTGGSSSSRSADAASPEQLFRLHRARPDLAVVLATQRTGGFRVGHIDRIFPKAGVVVVELEHPLLAGSLVQMRRINHDFSSQGDHQWSSPEVGPLFNTGKPSTPEPLY